MCVCVCVHVCVFQFGSRQQAVTNVYDYVESVSDVLEGINLDNCYIGLPHNRVIFSISREYVPLRITERFGR